MALVVPNAGEVQLLKKMLNQNQTAEMLLNLYQSNTTPNAFTTLGDLTPCNGVGYAAATVTNANWLIATPVGTTYAEAGYSEQTFTFGVNPSPQDVYGYYVTDTLGNLLWLERFTNAPFVVPAAGGTISVTLTINLENV
jgi:hypothetical protein